MFDRLQERLDDLSDSNGTSEELTARANQLFDFIHFLNALHARFVITMPEYPKQDHEREMWSEAYYDIEEAQGKLLDLRDQAVKASKDMDGWIKEAEEQEDDERKYGSYEDQVRQQYYSTR